MIKRFSSQTEADRFYIEEAFGERRNSHDPKARNVPQSAVAAILVGPDGEIARSANVLPPALWRSLEAEGRQVTDADRYHIIEHAERAAIFKAFMEDEKLEGSTIYCTRFPCGDCARAIIWAGIKRAVFPAGFAGEDRWLESQRAALRMLRSAGVKIRYLAEGLSVERE